MVRDTRIPREKGLDNSLSLMQEGYLYIPNRCRRFQSNIFETRLLGQKAICMSGEEAAEIFYDNDRFKRKGAAPKRVQKTLFGMNGVQTMDGAAHHHRKQLFMSLMTEKRLRVLKDITAEQWQASINEWENQDKVVLLEEARQIMYRMGCKWAGVPVNEEQVEQHAGDLGAMIDAFGAVGPRYQRGRRARARMEQWAQQIIKDVRNGKYEPPEQTAAYEMAFHRELSNRRLSTQMAAVELLNIIRPIVAISWFITYGTMAMHNHPEVREKVKQGGESYRKWFVQEVRRFYPFGPFTGARVRRNFTWKGHAFKKGTLVLLDLYGTNHHPDIWEEPEQFRPERFRNWKESPFDFIPQGGGEYDMGHRCAGEWVTIEVMKTSLAFLTMIDYEVPPQDKSIDMARMPTLPKSRFVITNVASKR
ncbi:cytochrome P450 [Sediminibacillus halophilus]|uniref:Fatty-acid peroxygenase n=1 Tax=Sediminibacillus halophilus TaxID=482461 RepID=A0A1G9NYI0_9BACI|nr:cytochrome P450 [Sediminibacillus halophilus]SDL91404.1 fatty-acid peroxygenase [Sediminibacillus halophilus]